MAEDTYFQGTVPSVDTTNVRDAAYRAMRLLAPLEVVLTRDLANTVNTEYAQTAGYYGGNQPHQNAYDSTSLYVLGRYFHAIQVYHTQASAISVQMEGSLDGFNWASIGSAIVADGITTFTGIYKYIRAHVVTVTLSGGPTYTAPYGVRVDYIGLSQQ